MVVGWILAVTAALAFVAAPAQAHDIVHRRHAARVGRATSASPRTHADPAATQVPAAASRASETGGPSGSVFDGGM